MFFKKNLPRWERALRVLAGIALLVLAWQSRDSIVGYLLAGAGFTAMLTATVGFCPMCALAGRKLGD